MDASLIFSLTLFVIRFLIKITESQYAMCLIILLSIVQ